MFRVLIASGRLPAERPWAAGSASALAHAALVLTIIVGARPAMQAAKESEAFFAQYLFPNQRTSAPAPSESAHFASVGTTGAAGVAATDDGSGAVAGDTFNPLANPNARRASRTAGAAGAEADQVAEQRTAAESQGAFMILDVDSAAVRDPTSAAPSYPPDLELKGVEGFARVRFVIDSTGLIDMETVKVIEASQPQFAKAVEDAMPRMHFRPALMGGHAVRQLAEQEFSFRLERSPAPADAKAARPARPPG